MKLVDKRGLSPIVASVMLVILVIVLGTIIFLWARGFVSEKVIKFQEPIENSCDGVIINAEAYSEKVHLSNSGTIPVYGIEIKKKSIGSSSSSGVIPFDSSVLAGETGEIDLPENINPGDSVTILPVLLGESGNSKKSYTCDKGIDASVGA